MTKAADVASLRQAATVLTTETRRQGLVSVTDPIIAWIESQGMQQGLLTIFCRHTSASLLIQENAAPEVRSDLERYFADLAPEHPTRYAHDEEGPDDMPAHLRAALTQVQLSIPIVAGVLVLGTWQGIYLFEHRRRPHRRTIALHLLGS